ncbi:MAG: hypothetical protein ACYC2U_08680, partial [Candidatus Amoebophilus sp.]
VTGTAPVNSKIVLSINNKPIQTVTANKESIWQTTIPNLKNGKYILQAAAQSLQGKLFKSKEITFSVNLPEQLLTKEQASIPTLKTAVTPQQQKAKPVSPAALATIASAISNKAQVKNNIENKNIKNKEAKENNITLKSSEKAIKDSTQKHLNASKAELVNTKATDIADIYQRKQDSSLSINFNNSKPKENGYIITGKAEPNSTITLLLNQKTLAKVNTAQDGIWKYRIPKHLENIINKNNNYISAVATDKSKTKHSFITHHISNLKF